MALLGVGFPDNTSNSTLLSSHSITLTGCFVIEIGVPDF